MKIEIVNGRLVDPLQGERSGNLYLADGRIAGIFCSSGEAAARRIHEGFALVTPGNDVGLLSKASKAAIAAARGPRP